MIREKFITVITIVCACFVASTLNAATIPAGTTLTVSTVSLISSQTVPGRSFEAKIAQDVSVKGNVVLKAGTKVFGKVTASRANPRKSGPLTVELASIDVNGHRIPVKTSSVQPAGPPQTARQARTTDIPPAQRLLTRKPGCSSNFCKLSRFNCWFA